MLRKYIKDVCPTCDLWNKGILCCNKYGTRCYKCQKIKSRRYYPDPEKRIYKTKPKAQRVADEINSANNFAYGSEGFMVAVELINKAYPNMPSYIILNRYEYEMMLNGYPLNDMYTPEKTRIVDKKSS